MTCQGGYCFPIVKRKVEMRNTLELLVRNLKGSVCSKDLDKDERIMLKWILKK